MKKDKTTFIFKWVVVVILLVLAVYLRSRNSAADVPETAAQAGTTITVEASAETTSETAAQAGTTITVEASAETTSETVAQGESMTAAAVEADYVPYTFRNEKLLTQHYEKHGIEMGFASAEDYEKAASDVVNDPDALHKTEAEDGDDVYYIEATNDFVIVSGDGYIRTYFRPDSGIDYYNRQ